MRRARTPPSTFLFLPIHLSNSAEDQRNLLSPDYTESHRSLPPDYRSETGHRYKVRSFAGAPSRRAAACRVETLYVGALPIVNRVGDSFFRHPWATGRSRLDRAAQSPTTIGCGALSLPRSAFPPSSREVRDAAADMSVFAGFPLPCCLSPWAKQPCAVLWPQFPAVLTAADAWGHTGRTGPFRCRFDARTNAPQAIGVGN
jgi:hypothetical protein